MKSSIIRVKLFTLFLVMGWNIYGQDPSLEWSISTGSYFSNGIVVNDSEVAVFTGGFVGTVDIDPIVSNTTVTSSGGYDVFVHKVDENGDFVWIKTFGGSGSERSYSIAMDDQENYLITGSFEGTVDFDPGSGVSNLTSNGDEDVFVLKLDSNGDFLWVKSFGGSGEDVGRSITVDAAGNVYTVGYFMGLVDMNPGAGIENHNGTSGYDDAFIQKLDGNGNFVWASTIGGTGDDRAMAVKVDGLGDVVVTGTFKNNIDFDPGTGVNLETSNGHKDAYVLKLDDNGDLDWVEVFGSSQWDEGAGLLIDGNNDIHIVGYFSNTIDFNPGPATNDLTSNGGLDAFYLKLNMFGNFIQAKSFGGVQNELAYKLAKDEFSNLYLTGVYSATTDFDPGVGVFNLTSNGVGDNFLLKLDQNAEFLWAGSFGTHATDHCNDIAVDQYENIYLTGSYQLTIDMDPDTGVFELTTAGAYNVYVSKFNQCYAETGIDSISACDSYVWIDGNTYTTDNNTASFLFEGGSVQGCDSIVYLELTINHTPTTDVSFELETTCKGVLVHTDNNTSGTDYSWQMDNGITSSEENPQFLLPYGNQYTLHFEADNNGCLAAMDTVFEVADITSYIHNANANVFTPNGDGKNDLYQLSFPDELKTCTSISVYNRWGKPVFESSQNNWWWDGQLNGKPVPEGTYYYLLKIDDYSTEGSISLFR